MSVQRSMSPTTNSWSAQLKVGPTERNKRPGSASPAGSNHLRYALKDPPPSAFPSQCIARWASGASGALAPGLVDPVGSSGIRPAHGRSFSTHHSSGIPARRSQRSESARSRGGNVKVKTQTRGAFAFAKKGKPCFFPRRYLLALTADPR